MTSSLCLFTYVPCSRIEDKLDALNVQTESFTVRMAPAPGQKKVPLQFQAWLCIQEDTMTDNIFITSQLLTDKQRGSIICF